MECYLEVAAQHGHLVAGLLFFPTKHSVNWKQRLHPQAPQNICILLLFGGFYMYAIKKVCNYTEAIKKGDRTQVPLL